MKNVLYNVTLSLNCLLLFLLFFGSRIYVPSWLQVAGRLHPLIVHFPLVLVLLYCGIFLFSNKKTKTTEPFINMMDNLLLASALVAVMAAVMGYLLSKEPGYDEEALSLHEWSGCITSFVLFAIYNVKGKLKHPVINYAYVTIICLLIIFTGHFGANITHGEDYVFAPMIPEPQKKQVAFEDAMVYNDLVYPILEQKCVSCHNSTKAKGELVMETPEMLMKGGKNGVPWDTTTDDLGLLLHRIHLPEDDKKHMPPAGKAQLSDKEKEILYAWIQSGSQFDQRLAELPPTDTLHAIGLKNLRSASDEIFDFEQADEKEIARLNNNNRVITPLFTVSPALAVTFFNSQFYSSAGLKELEPVSQQITDLNLVNMPVSDEDLKIIGTFQNLRQLNLSSTNVTGSSLRELQKIPHLKSLSLSDTKITNSSVRSLHEFPALRSVYVWNTNVDEEQLAKVKKEDKNVSWFIGFKGDTVVLKLNPPILENEERVIESTIPLMLKNYVPGTVIRYSMDGSDPDSISSPVFDGKVTIDGSMEIKAKSYKTGWHSSDIASFHFFKTKYLPDSSILLSKPNPKYEGNGAATLFDKELSDQNQASGKWLGYNVKPMIAQFHFDNTIEPNRITLSLLQNIGQYIFPPASVEVWVGSETKRLHLVKKILPKQPDKDTENLKSLAFSFDLKSEKINVIRVKISPIAKLPSWHRGKGEKGWIFIDEIFVD